MERTYFIYRYVRLDKNVPFYIGKGTVKEYDQYGYVVKSVKVRYWRAYDKTRNHICVGIMNKTPYDIEIMYETTDLNHVAEKEKEFIKLYGIVYDGSGTLVNLTMGGDSCFQVTKEFSRRHVEARRRNGTYSNINLKKVYMYDLDGTFLEEFKSCSEFYSKYSKASKSSTGISTSIRKRVSHCGYFFSHSFYDKLDTSNYMVTITQRIPVVQLDSDGKILNEFKSIRQVAVANKIDSTSAERKILKGIKINGSLYKRMRIHELYKIKNSATN